MSKETQMVRGEDLEYRRLGRPIDERCSGKRVDDYLAKNFLFRSRTTWQSMIRDGKVLVNGRTIKASSRLGEGDQVLYYRPQSSEPPVNTNLSILWEKDGVVAIYKPTNLPMHEGGAYRRNTFCEVLKDFLSPEWAPIHRLDRETSGIVLCSDKSQLRTELSGHFAHRRVLKKYLAIAIGKATTPEWYVDQPIGDSKTTTFRQKFWVEPDGLSSQTHFKVRSAVEGATFLEVSPRTGRTHQIRVHASWSGFPLVGDKKYYPDERIYLEYDDKGFSENVRKACLFDRLCLHATYLSFTHPGDKKTYEVECPLPEDMQSIWNSFQPTNILK